MPVTSLPNFTVPGAGGEQQGVLMPKLKYRFRAFFTNFGDTEGANAGQSFELTKQVMNITRPEVSFDPITIELYNSKTHMAGKHTWGDMTVELRDDVDGLVSSKVGRQLQKQLDFFNQSAPPDATDYKFQLGFEILDGRNGAQVGVLEAWEIQGAFLQAANYNTMDYTSNEPATISLTVKFDNAVQTVAPGGGVGGQGTLSSAIFG